MDRWRSHLLARLMVIVIGFITVTILLRLPIYHLAFFTRPEGIGTLGGIAFAGVCLWLARKGYYRATLSWGMLFSSILVFALALATQGSNALNLLYYPLALTLLCGVFLTPRRLLVISATQIAVMLILSGQIRGLTPVDVLVGPIYFNLLLDAMFLLVAAALRRLINQRQAQLAESEARYRLLVESVGDIVGVISPTGEILQIYISAEAEGWSRPELTGAAFKSLVHPDDLHKIDAMFDRTLARQPAPLTEVRMSAYTGEYDWFEIKAAPFTENGKVTGTSIVARNVTERKRGDEALRESENRYRLVSELVSDYAFSFRIEPDGKLEYEWGTNSLKRLSGLDWNEMQRTGRFIQYHPDDRAAADADIRSVLSGKSHSGEYRIITPDGDLRWIRVYRRADWDEHEQRAVRLYGVAQDITERKRLEAEQLRLAVERERFSVVNRFVHAVSHDFRTVMASIEMSRYLIQRLLAQPERDKVQPKLNTIRDGVTHLADQIENLTTIVSLIELKRQPCNLNAVLRTLEEEYRDRAAQKALTFSIECADDLPPIKADQGEIASALRHLLNNAINFTPEQGVVTVRTLPKPGVACIEIRDTGVGIEPMHLPHIFDLFYRGDNARPTHSGGVGLGLSIAKMIAEAHAGQITVTSTPGQGSTFTLILPV
jgi:PAS domain S-box-containing protein